MTPQELKHSIIFLALQGKLVGQIKDDSPIDLSGIKSQKTEECEKRGIRLVHIFEDEWLNKKDIWLQTLKDI